MALAPAQREPRDLDVLMTPPETLTPSAIFTRAALSDDLAAVEQLLMKRTASRSPEITAAGAHTIAAGGKRLRAALVLLAARLGEYRFERAIHPAAAIELLHTASLVHDDLADHAPLRRGVVTVHERWNEQVALMLGDYFFAVSADELAQEPDPRIIRFYAEAAQTVVAGELSPVTQLVPFDVAFQQYRIKIGSKTAALFEAACKAGIAVAGGTPEQIEMLGRFGFELGVAFQIIDDVLDFVGDPALLGKPAGNDLREGTLTLPLIYAVVNSADPLLQEVAETAMPNPDDVSLLVAAVVAEGGPERAQHEAHLTIQRALHYLDGFAPSPAKRALQDICAFVLTRQS